MRPPEPAASQGGPFRRHRAEPGKQRLGVTESGGSSSRRSDCRFSKQPQGRGEPLERVLDPT
eukprot:13057375-Alexandrium_andersonii.AAC.1